MFFLIRILVFVSALSKTIRIPQYSKSFLVVLEASLQYGGNVFKGRKEEALAFTIRLTINNKKLMFICNLVSRSYDNNPKSPGDKVG